MDVGHLHTSFSGGMDVKLSWISGIKPLIYKFLPFKWGLVAKDKQNPIQNLSPVVSWLKEDS